MRKIGIGRTAEVFLDDDGYAVKLFYDWMPEAAAQHEAAILREVSGVCPCAPRFFELYRSDGRNGLRFEFIKGKMLGELLLKNPLGFFGLCRAMSALHGEIHSSEAAGLRPGDEKFCSALQEYGGTDADTKRKLFDFVRTHSKKSLCHGDFHPENIMIEDEGRFRVIDWVTSYSGDPLSDVARTYYLIRYGVSPNKRTLLQRTLESVGKPLIANTYLRAYFPGGRFLKKDFELWLLVVMIHRFVRERIPEEEGGLKKALARQLTKVSRSAWI